MICDGNINQTNYEIVKKIILSFYFIAIEGYRQAFRKSHKMQYQAYHKFASDKVRALKRRLKSASVNIFDKLVNLVALKEFVRKVPHSVEVRIIDRIQPQIYLLL